MVSKESQMYTDFKTLLKSKLPEEKICDEFFENIVKLGIIDEASPYMRVKKDIDNFRKPSMDIPSISKFTHFFEKYSAEEILQFLVDHPISIPVKAQLRAYEVLLKRSSLELFPQAFKLYRGALLFYSFTWDHKVDELDDLYSKNH